MGHLTAVKTYHTEPLLPLHRCATILGEPLPPFSCPVEAPYPVGARPPNIYAPRSRTDRWRPLHHPRPMRSDRVRHAHASCTGRSGPARPCLGFGPLSSAGFHPVVLGSVGQNRPVAGLTFFLFKTLLNVHRNLIKLPKIHIDSTKIQKKCKVNFFRILLSRSL
jgi:hypothetical protein